MKSLVAFIVLFWSVFATASDTIQWGNLATIDQESIRLKAKEYIHNAMPEIRGVEVKLINVSASYDFRYKRSTMQVMFMHSMSFVEGEGKEQVVYVGDKPQVIKMNKIQYVFIDFKGNGEATQHRVEQVPFNGSKQAFMEEFSRF